MRKNVYWTLMLMILIFSNRFTSGQDEEVQAPAPISVEVSFEKTPVSPRSDAILKCNVFGDVDRRLVGITRYNDNGMNTVVYRNGNLLQDAPDHFKIDFPSTDDGATMYRITIADVNEVADGGMYTCYVLDDARYVVAIATTRLDVTPAHLLPECSSSSGDGSTDGTIFVAQTEVTLSCTALDSTATAQWSRSGLIDIPSNQNMTRDIISNTVTTTLTQTFSKSDEGASFTCNILNDVQAVIHGRECTIGPISIQPSNTTVAVATIGGLSITAFALTVTFVSLLLIICIVSIIFCFTKGRRSSIRRGRGSSKSYRISEGRLGSFADSTLTRDGTLTGGRESFTYSPTRVAPPPPAIAIINGDATHSAGGNRRSSGLSAVEAALLAAVVGGGDTQGRNSGIRNSTSDEIIYANTDQINMPHLDSIAEENGIDNPEYVSESPTRPTAASRKPPLSHAPVVYSNSTELASISSLSENSSSNQEDQPKPFVLPQSSNNTTFNLKPVPKSKPKTKQPTSNDGRDPPSKPSPHAKPAKQTPEEPLRPTPPVKPNNRVSSSPQVPVPPVKPVNEGSAAVSAALRPPPPPNKPTYDISQNGPPSPPTPDYQTTQLRPSPPPKKPSVDGASSVNKPLAPPKKPNVGSNAAQNKPLAPPKKPNLGGAAAQNKPPAPPKKPNVGSASPDKPPAPPKKPTYEISEDRPRPPPKPSPRNSGNVANNAPPPPMKPKYQI